MSDKREPAVKTMALVAMTIQQLRVALERGDHLKDDFDKIVDRARRMARRAN